MFDPGHRNRTVRRRCELLRCELLGEHDMPNRRMALCALDRLPSPVTVRASAFVVFRRTQRVVN